MTDVNPHMVKQTITFSDGTETVINYRGNEEAAAIEEASAALVEEHKEPEAPEAPKIEEEEIEEAPEL